MQPASQWNANPMSPRVALLCLALLAVEVGRANGLASCPSTRQSSTSSGVRFTVYSHSGYEIGTPYASRADCNWQIDAPGAGMAWRITFEHIELETASTPSRCKYDNLTVQYQFNNQQVSKLLCGMHRNLLLVTNSSFRLQFQSDSSITLRGFKIYWEAISQRDAEQIIASNQISPVFLPDGTVGSCSRLTRAGNPVQFAGNWYNTTILYMSSAVGNYYHHADCTYFVTSLNMARGEYSAAYITFEYVQLEGVQGACVHDNITVSYQLRRLGPTRRRVFCRLNRNISLVSARSALLELRTDGSVGTGLNITWFVAPYIGLNSPFPTSPEFTEEQCAPIVTTPQGKLIRMYYYPPLTYEPGTTCTWSFSIPPQTMVEFKFHRFDLGRSRYIHRPFYYNFSSSIHFCSVMDDAVIISFKRSSLLPIETAKFCSNSAVQLGQVVVTSVDSATVSFRSVLRSRGGQGFVLEARYRNRQEIPARSSCPQPVQLDQYKSQIAIPPNEIQVLTGVSECSWTLAPRDAQHLLALTLTLNSDSPDRFRSPPPDLEQLYCLLSFRIVTDSMVDASALNFTSQPPTSSPSELQARATIFRRFCPPMQNRKLGLFSGAVEASYRNNAPVLDFQGFNLTILNIPRPRTDCAKVKISTVYGASRAFKVFEIQAKAGCVLAEFLKSADFSQLYSRTLLKVSFHLNCSDNNSKETLDIISQLFISSVGCLRSTVAYDSWDYPLVLKFPSRTDTHLVLKVQYNFPVVEEYCRRLSRWGGLKSNGTLGEIHLPLFVSRGILPMMQEHYPQLSCRYDLAHRPGYNILLRITHNLNFQDIDFYCHSKLAARDMSSHILVTVKQQDPDNAGDFIEQQLELCHGYSVGSLATKSEILVTGDIKINLLAIRADNVDMGSSIGIALLQILNTTLLKQLNFVFSYEYVPACPELQCRSASTGKLGCRGVPVSDMVLESNHPGPVESQCKLNIPTSSTMRQAMSAASSRWLAEVTVSNFNVRCPCPSCAEDDQLITIGHKPAHGDPATDAVVICGNHRNSSKVAYLALTSEKPDIQVAYSFLDAGLNLSVRFIDCAKSPSFEQCSVAQKDVWGLKQFVSVVQRSHGGLIFLIVVLLLLLLACLLFINRETLFSRGSRVQAALRSRQSHADDTLQLTHEAD